MTAIAWSPISWAKPDLLVVLDADRRLYVGLDAGGRHWHVIRPRRAEERPWEGRTGALACDCEDHCEWLKTAKRFESGRIDVAPETELERAAARG